MHDNDPMARFRFTRQLGLSVAVPSLQALRDLKLNNLPIMSGGREIAFGEYGYHGIGSISSLN